ncbi:MAG: hypothetical protein B6226_04730 [Candidatus Cloacimonetes bacterium 4572_65]|nr:MAG: hypothetical protein B6226_04730 [Candidatus Cloacimonetes bacterium 4572_65]
MLTAFMLLSCSANRVKKRNITDFKLKGRVTIDYSVKDVALDSTTNTVFVAEKESNKIWIYHDYEYINKIGGRGLGEAKFQSLSDLDVSNQGHLLVLDNLQKRISIIDKDGQFVGKLNLQNVKNPVRFAVDSNEMLYIYDNNEHEIVVNNLLTGNEFIRFGKFEIDFPKNMTVNADKLNITNYNNSNLLYGVMGNFVAEYSGMTVVDEFNTILKATSNTVAVNENSEIKIVSLNKIENVILYGRSLVLVTEKSIEIYEIRYDKGMKKDYE